jgi:hypothetical protein
MVMRFFGSGASRTRTGDLLGAIRRSAALSLPWLQGICAPPRIAKCPEFVRSLREIAGVPSRGRREVMKLVGRVRARVGRYCKAPEAGARIDYADGRCEGPVTRGVCSRSGAGGTCGVLPRASGIVATSTPGKRHGGETHEHDDGDCPSEEEQFGDE